MATFTYILCAVTSIVCTVLLVRGYLATRARLLLWTSLAFVGFALNNLMLVIDKSSAQIELSFERALPTFVGMMLLIWGLIWESR